MEPDLLTYAAGDKFGKDKPVYVLDDIKVKPGAQQAMLALMEERYLPLAREREMDLVGVFAFPPFERADAPANLVYLWRFSSLQRWWQIRAIEENDARLPAFWRDAAPLIIERSRKLGRPPQLMTGLTPDRARIKPFGLPPSGSRHIAFVKPAAPVAKEAEQSWCNAAAALAREPGIHYSRAGFHIDFSFHPGHMTWDIVTDAGLPLTPERLRAALPGAADIIEFATLGTPVFAHLRAPVGPLSEKRTIFFRADAGLSAAALSNLESTLDELGRQVEGVHTWCLTPLLHLEGSVQWTHCFEQEFTSHEVVTTDYLFHPHHWTIADRLFGPEGPEKAVHEFVHTIRELDGSMFAEIALGGEFGAGG